MSTDVEQSKLNLDELNSDELNSDVIAAVVTAVQLLLVTADINCNHKLFFLFDRLSRHRGY